MRTTINLDDELLKEARELTGIAENPSLVRLALERLVQTAAAGRLARLGGGDKKAKAAGLAGHAGDQSRDFSEFAGIWTDEEAAAFDSATARHVDPGDWV
jgi:Arc/MetJ family transcription regulator